MATPSPRLLPSALALRARTPSPHPSSRLRLRRDGPSRAGTPDHRHRLWSEEDATVTSIRTALGAPQQTVRVVDAETGEVFELRLGRTDPYAVPASPLGIPSPPGTPRLVEQHKILSTHEPVQDSASPFQRPAAIEQRPGPVLARPVARHGGFSPNTLPSPRRDSPRTSTSSSGSTESAPDSALGLGTASEDRAHSSYTVPSPAITTSTVRTARSGKPQEVPPLPQEGLAALRAQALAYIPPERPTASGQVVCHKRRISRPERFAFPPSTDFRCPSIGKAGETLSPPRPRYEPARGAIYTGDEAFDQEANMKAERLRRRKTLAQEGRGRPQSPEKRQEAQESTAVEKVSAPTPSMGKLIDESHANYVLMYNMLTGIRIAVSRCEAQPRRPLTSEDYHARHKFTFDIVGNELGPKTRYDFKFKSYSSEVFRDLRRLFRLDAADYLYSLTSQYILSELGSPGKSGSFFYFSRDYRFIIKTICHSEHKFLLSILNAYHEHVRNNPHTLLSRFYGLHRVKLPGGKKIHFVIMNNLFPPHRDIHETYDLKGSLVGREYSEEKAAWKSGATMKDINFLRRARHLELGPEKNGLFHRQLELDVALLAKLRIMDYSLLVGLHDMRRGNKENLRVEKLSVFQPSLGAAKEEANQVRQAIERSDPHSLKADHLSEFDGKERQFCLFYAEDGGFRSSNQQDEPGEWIYYFGIIDLFTLYTPLKRAEHMFKSAALLDHKWLSPVRPQPYGQRFLRFMHTISAPPPVNWPGWRGHATGGEAARRVEEQAAREGRVPYGSEPDPRRWLWL